MPAHVTWKFCSYGVLGPDQEPDKSAMHLQPELASRSIFLGFFAPIRFQRSVYLCQHPTGDWPFNRHWSSLRVNRKAPLDALRFSMCSIVAQHWLVAEFPRLRILLSRDNHNFGLCNPSRYKMRVVIRYQVSSLPLIIHVGRLARVRISKAKAMLARRGCQRV